MITTNENIFYDDKLLNLIKSNFNENDMELFNLNYKFYIANKNNIDDFIVDLDEVYKWVGYTTKSDAKKVLTRVNNGFKINKDYKIFLRRSPEEDSAVKHGGSNKEQILLTINCFKKFCLKASTEKADKFYDYYIKMEDIITKYIENKQIFEINKDYIIKMNTLIAPATTGAIKSKGGENKEKKSLFEINKDYIIKMNENTFPLERVKVNSRPIEIILLTINCFTPLHI
jgi:phage anti-repressor protein